MQAGQITSGPTSPQVMNQSSQPSSLLYVKTDQQNHDGYNPDIHRRGEAPKLNHGFIPPAPPKDYSQTSSPPPIPHKHLHNKSNISPASSFGDVLNELRSKNGSVNGDPPPLPRSQPPKIMNSSDIPEAPPLPGPDSPDEQIRVVTDIYGREKTIRIGKWRWPPPRGDGNDPNTSFFAFKMQKQQEKQTDNINDGGFEGFEYRDIEPEEYHTPKGVSRGPYDETDETPVRDGPVIRAFDGETRPDPGSIKKLRISSEMKAKLEQLTMDHSVRSSHKDDRARMYQMAPGNDSKSDSKDGHKRGVKKLAANRKALLEAQLSGSMRKHQDVADASPQREKRNQTLSQEFYTEDARKAKSHSDHKKISQETNHNSDSRHIQHSQSHHNSRSYHQTNQYDESNHEQRNHFSKNEGELYVPRPIVPKDVSNRPPAPEKHSRLSKPPSTVASSSYYAPSTPVVPQTKRPPPPIIPDRISSRKSFNSDQIES